MGRGASSDSGFRVARLPYSRRNQFFLVAMGHPARRTIFHRTGTVRAGALARRPNSQWQTAEILLLSVWRWAQGLCRSGLRNDGSDAAAGDDCATLPAHAQAGPDSRAAIFGDAAAEEWDADGAARAGVDPQVVTVALSDCIPLAPVSSTLIVTHRPV